MDLRARESALIDGVKQWLRCLALANICLVRVWSELLRTGRPSFETNVTPERFWAALCLTPLLASVFFLAWKAHRIVWHAAVIVAALVAAKEAFYVVSNGGWVQRDEVYRWLVWPSSQAAVAGAAMLLAFAAFRFLIRGGPRVKGLATILVPFALLNLGNGVVQALQPAPPQPLLRYETPGQSTRPGKPRVVWIILDELDERIAFSRRPAGVDLPHLDRFRRDAGFAARNAQSPATATFVSLPSLLSGSPQRHLTARPPVLARFAEAGFRIGLTGWALPYCPTIQGLARCESAPMNWQSNSYGTGLIPIMVAQARSLFETNVFSPFGQSQTSRQHVETLRRLERSAGQMAGSGDLDFVFIHLPAPHGPFVFNPKSGRPDAWSRPRTEGYLNNLLLADQVFASIRSEMERTGVWEQSIVLVSADHGYRQGELLGYPPAPLHVPFMLKLPPGLRLDRDPDAPLKTIDTGKILAELLDLTTS